MSVILFAVNLMVTSRYQVCVFATLKVLEYQKWSLDSQS